MRRIALLSDTHGFLDDRMVELMQSCDEIWHAGDIGSNSVTDRLLQIKPLRAVCGNIDGGDLRMQFPMHQRFLCEEVDVCLVHIGGYPGHWDQKVLPILKSNPPDLMIAGHSHILRVIYDPKYELLYLNPGAAGVHGFHLVRSLIRFSIDGDQIRDLEVVELGPRSVSAGKTGGTPV